MIDLRSDTVTMPTSMMMEAISNAKLGDDVYEEDPTVNELERLAASMMGTESALLISSGTMGNLIANLIHCPRGTEVILGDLSHTFLYENGGISGLGGIHSHQLPNNDDGTIDMEKISNAIRTDDVHFPKTKLISLENTHNKCYGAPLDINYINSVCDLAHENNISVHMDGARLFNACTALNIAPDQVLANVDSVTFCLSKGLSAPMGSILCGTSKFINNARYIRKSIGGGMRQSGIIAAAGIISLEHMVNRIADDHENAQLLASGLKDIHGIDIDVTKVKTNIIFFNITHDSITQLEFVKAAKERKILLNDYNGKHCRLVLHSGISKNDVEKVILEFNKLLS